MELVGVIDGLGRIAPICREYVVWSQLQSCAEPESRISSSEFNMFVVKEDTRLIAPPALLLSVYLISPLRYRVIVTPSPHPRA